MKTLSIFLLSLFLIFSIIFLFHYIVLSANESLHSKLFSIFPSSVKDAYGFPPKNALSSPSSVPLDNSDSGNDNASSVQNIDELNEKGDNYYNKGNYEEAIIWYDKALAIDPQHVMALYNKGSALYSLGKYEEAITWLDKALAIDPNFSLAKNNKEEALSKLNDESFDEASTSEEDTNQPPLIKSSKIIVFSGVNYADVVNSRDINLNSFTVSVWFNTIMNVISGNNGAFLLNKGGIGIDRPGYNLNYGLFLTDENKVSGGFETLIGEDYYVTSSSAYNDGNWHNAILTFDEKLHMLKLYMDGIETSSNPTKVGVKPDNTGNQHVRLGSNSFEIKGKVNGNYTGQLDDIQVWDYVFTKEQVASLFDTESKIDR